MREFVWLASNVGDQGAMIKIVFAFCFVLIGGCLGVGAFQPSPPYFQSWVKEGAAELDVKKSLLECGAASPYGGGNDANEFALVHFCMVRAGYMPYEYYSKQVENPDSWCRNWPALPACQLGAEIPVPDLSRRLQSEYCKIRSSSESCFALMGHESEFCKRLSFEKPFPECVP